MKRAKWITGVQAWLKAAIFAAFSVLATAVQAERLDQPSALSRIELEVKLLRAEMALVDGHQTVARKLLQEVEPQLMHYPAYRPRWKALMDRLPSAQPRSTASLSFSGPPPFSCAEPYVALLPLSGPLGEAGRALVQGLAAANCAPEDTLDTALFDAVALLQMVNLYRPAWVLGPLRPAVIEAWTALSPRWPALLLGRIPDSLSCPQCMTLTMRAVDQLLQGGLLDAVPAPRLVLVPERFRDEVPAIMQAQEEWHFYSGAIARHLREWLGIEESRARHGYLQHLVGRPVKHVPRARADLQTLFLIGSLADAQQTAALLQFWQVPTRFVWLPASLHRAIPRSLVDASWPTMVVFLPPFSWQTEADTFETGMFRALGESVGRRLQVEPADTVITSVGRMSWHEGTLNVTFLPYFHEQGKHWRPLMWVPTDN